MTQPKPMSEKLVHAAKSILNPGENDRSHKIRAVEVPLGLLAVRVDPPKISLYRGHGTFIWAIVADTENQILTVQKHEKLPGKNQVFNTHFRRNFVLDPAILGTGPSEVPSGRLPKSDRTAIATSLKIAGRFIDGYKSHDPFQDACARNYFLDMAGPLHEDEKLLTELNFHPAVIEQYPTLVAKHELEPEQH